MIKITRHTKMPVRLSWRGGSAKQGCILAAARPLSSGPVPTTAGFASPWQWSPVQAKLSQKPWCRLPHILHSTLLLRKPVRAGTSRSLQKSRRGQRRRSRPCPGMCGTTWAWRQATLFNLCSMHLLGGMYKWDSSKLARTQMQLKTLFLPSGSLQSLAFSFQNFRGKLYLGDSEGIDGLGFF